MTEYTLPPVTDKRARYFDGQYLQDQDFIIEQDYQRDREHRHTRQLHGSGIAEGLTVTSAAPGQVTVGPGTAIDSNGYQLVLADATTVDLASLTAPQQGITLYVSYRAAATDPQNGEAGLDTRWQEIPRLTPVPPGADLPARRLVQPGQPGRPRHGAAPRAARACWTSQATAAVTVDTSKRSYAGLHVPGTLTVDAQHRRRHADPGLGRGAGARQGAADRRRESQ